MKKYFQTLKRCPLFQGITENELLVMLECLGARVIPFRKKETIIAEGQPAKYIGIILRGSAQIIQVDYFGKRSIVAGIEASELLGESFA